VGRPVVVPVVGRPSRAPGSQPPARTLPLARRLPADSGDRHARPAPTSVSRAVRIAQAEVAAAASLRL